jgi:hypothetical protein
MLRCVGAWGIAGMPMLDEDVGMEIPDPVEGDGVPNSSRPGIVVLLGTLEPLLA